MVVTTLKILRVYNSKNFAQALRAIFLSPPIQNLTPLLHVYPYCFSLKYHYLKSQ